MLRALEYVHSKKLVHMDVKVPNLLPHHVKVRFTMTLAFALPCMNFQHIACRNPGLPLRPLLLTELLM